VNGVPDGCNAQQKFLSKTPNTTYLPFLEIFTQQLLAIPTDFSVFLHVPGDAVKPQLSPHESIAAMVLSVVTLRVLRTLDKRSLQLLNIHAPDQLVTTDGVEFAVGRAEAARKTPSRKIRSSCKSRSVSRSIVPSAEEEKWQGCLQSTILGAGNRTEV
jgi:hypothetical protein